MGYIYRVEEKKGIEDHIEIILSPSRHPLSLHSSFHQKAFEIIPTMSGRPSLSKQR